MKYLIINILWYVAKIMFLFSSNPAFGKNYVWNILFNRYVLKLKVSKLNPAAAELLFASHTNLMPLSSCSLWFKLLVILHTGEKTKGNIVGDYFEQGPSMCYGNW